MSDAEDVNLIKKTLYAYNSTGGLTDKAKRSIGNLVLQCCHSNNLPNVALDVRCWSCINIILYLILIKKFKL